jgi:uncharacterized paraquat-inducible protein A
VKVRRRVTRKCPFCGTEFTEFSFNNRGPDDTLVCPNCRGQFKDTLRPRWHALIICSMALGGLIPFALAVALGRLNLNVYPTLAVTGVLLGLLAIFIIRWQRGELEAVTAPVICSRCGSALPAADAAFCVRCGARLFGQTELESKQIKRVSEPVPAKKAAKERTTGKVCMVCDLILTSNDVLAWCPACGNVAHREHLLQWVRDKKRCPLCGHVLDERSIKLSSEDKIG